MYVNDRGNMIAITFIDGVPQQEIPEGFRPLGETAAPEVSAIGDGAGGASWSDGMTAAEIRDAQARGDFTPKGQTPSKSFADYTAEDWAGWSPGMGQRVGDIASLALNFAVPGVAGAALGAGAKALGSNITLSGYTGLNDFISTLDINDPAYNALTEKRDALYSELVDANTKTGGRIAEGVRNMLGLERPEIPAPTTGIVEDYTLGRTPTPPSSTAERGSVPGFTPSAIAPTESPRPPSRPATTPSGGGGDTYDYSRSTSPTYSETARSVSVPGHTASEQARSTPAVAPAPAPSRGGSTGGGSTSTSTGGSSFGSFDQTNPRGFKKGGLMGKAKPAPRKRGRAARKSKK
jgi:hypothetical protein